METKSIKVIGKVQGVYFRASTKETADKLGVKGWVRNEADGSVQIEAEADSEIMKEFIKWCSVGPKMARVDEMKITDRKEQGFTSFEARWA